VATAVLRRGPATRPFPGRQLGRGAQDMAPQMAGHGRYAGLHRGRGRRRHAHDAALLRRGAGPDRPARSERRQHRGGPQDHPAQQRDDAKRGLCHRVARSGAKSGLSPGLGQVAGIQPGPSAQGWVVACLFAFPAVRATGRADRAQAGRRRRRADRGFPAHERGRASGGADRDHPAQSDRGDAAQPLPRPRHLGRIPGTGHGGAHRQHLRRRLHRTATDAQTAGDRSRQRVAADANQRVAGDGPGVRTGGGTIPARERTLRNHVRHRDRPAVGRPECGPCHAENAKAEAQYAFPRPPAAEQPGRRGQPALVLQSP